MNGKARSAVVAGSILAAVSVWTQVMAAPAPVPTDAQRHECERNGGYWVTASGYCKIGA